MLVAACDGVWLGYEASQALADGVPVPVHIQQQQKTITNLAIYKQTSVLFFRTCKFAPWNEIV